MKQKVLIIFRASAISWGYAITLGSLCGVRLFWIVQEPYSGTRVARLRGAAEAVVRTSPYIVLTGSLFAVLAMPLAVWSIGSASWSSLKKYVYVFWLVLAIYIIAFGNADGLILISGVGLIGLWFLANRKSLNPTEVGLSHKPHAQMPLQRLGISSDFAIFAVLVLVTCALSLFLFFGNGTKAYVSEIFAIYAAASICQGFRAFATNVHDQNASPERTP